MIAMPINIRSKPGFAWLLWLALLLPLAQLAAAWHTQSHWSHQQSSAGGGKHAPAGDRCEVCLTAAAVTGGGAASTALLVAQAPIASPSPPTREESAWSAPASPAYESRAPPLSPR
jgi:hypothetical protein